MIPFSSPYSVCMQCTMQPSVGIVIVDPATKEIIAQAHTDADHPTRHAVMVCIDNVAKRQGGGVWHNASEGKKQTRGRYIRLIPRQTSHLTSMILYMTNSDEEFLH